MIAGAISPSDRMPVGVADDLLDLGDRQCVVLAAGREDHAVRVRVLQLLREGELSVGALQRLTLTPAAPRSAQLRCAAGARESRRDGTSVYHRLVRLGYAQQAATLAPGMATRPRVRYS